MSDFAPQVLESCPPLDRRFLQSESRGVVDSMSSILMEHHEATVFERN